MFFKKRSYFDKIQARTKKGAKNSAKDALRKAESHIDYACDQGMNSTRVSYDLSKRDKVQQVAQHLSDQGFKTEVEEETYYTYLTIQW